MEIDTLICVEKLFVINNLQRNSFKLVDCGHKACKQKTRPERSHLISTPMCQRQLFIKNFNMEKQSAPHIEVILSNSSGLEDCKSQIEPSSNMKYRKGSTNSVASSIIKGTTLLCYRMSDVVVCVLLLLPLNIGFWRGVWQIMDSYSIQYSLDPWLSLIMGNLIPFVLYYMQEPLKKLIRPSSRGLSFISFYIVTRFLLLFHAFGSVNQWRGLWVMLDNETGVGNESAVISLVVGITCLMLLKSFTNVLAIPLFVGVDDANNIHDCPFRYNTHAASKCFYLMDCLVTVFIIQNLVVASWRGLWNLAQNLIYPEDLMTSSLWCVAIGAVIVLSLCALQPCHYRALTNTKGFVRLLLFDAITLIGFIGCVLSWRGTWELYNLLIVFETPLYSEWLTAIIGAIGCCLLGCISTIFSRGVAIDGDDSNGSTEWPISYITLLQKTRHGGVPFPEPWLFRYLCTSQKMMRRDSMQRRMSSFNEVKTKNFNLDGDATQLNQPIKNLVEKNEQVFCKTYISTLRNIDSSSSDEEENKVVKSDS